MNSVKITYSENSISLALAKQALCETRANDDGLVYKRKKKKKIPSEEDNNNAI